MAEKQNVLITGCSSGFGALISKTLALAGHKVYATMRSPEERNKQAKVNLLDFVSDHNCGIEIIELDILSDESVNRAVSQIIQKDGRIDAIVNNAGLGALGIIESFSLSQIQHVFEVNTFGPVRLNHAVLPYMKQAGKGLLIHITSAAGRICFPFLGAYNASKFAIEAFVESYTYELGPLGIDFCAIEPGAFPSELHNKRLVPEKENVLSSYGDIAKVPDQMVEAMVAIMEQSTPPDPQQVADKVLELLSLPTGKRPLRSVVGEVATAGVRELNQATEDCLQMFLKSMQPN